VSSHALDTVKLDRSLIAGLGTSRSAAALVRAVVDMTRSLGLDTVAEGLEEAGQLEAARELGCTYGQGWHIARPMDARAASELVADVRTRHAGALAPLAA
jgi:EAL domain-containing protein (putative c-di-GMP-specific phosphodiesterase class I)